MLKTLHFKSLFLLLCLIIGGSSSAWGEGVTYDFSQITGFSSWGTGYSKHEVNYTEATVTFKEANKQSSTITDIPVTKGQDVTLVAKDDKTIKNVSFTCRQWGTKAQTITLHYSIDGGKTYTSTGVTSTNFSISKDGLPAGTNAVKITFSSTSNQVGIASATVTYAAAGPIDLDNFSFDNLTPTVQLQKGNGDYEASYTQAVSFAPSSYNGTILYYIDFDDNNTTLTNNEVYINDVTGEVTILQETNTSGSVVVVAMGDAVSGKFNAPDEAKYILTINPYKPDVPSFSVATGSIDYGTSLTLSAADGTTIRYFLDGTNPTNSTGEIYSAPLSIKDNWNVRAVAIDGEFISDIASAVYTINTPANVTLEPAGGNSSNKKSVQYGTVVTMSHSMAPSLGAIRYTTNGTIPKNQIDEHPEKVFEYSSPIVITDNVRIKPQFQTENGKFWSAEAPDNYYVIATPDAPTASVATGTEVEKNSTVTLSHPLLDNNLGKIYYTVDGTEPTKSSTEYNGGIAIDVDKTIKARFITNGDHLGEIATFEYTYLREDAELAYATTAFEVTINSTFDTPILTNPHSVAVTYSSSDETIAEVNAESGAVTIKDKEGDVTIYARSDRDATYYADEASYTITVYDPNRKGSQWNPYTVAEALEITCQLSSTETIDNVYVRGIVSKITTSNNQYYISDDGLTDNQFYVYNGKYLNKDNFTNSNKLSIGDVVIVYGNLQNYEGKTPEFKKDNYLFSLKRRTNPDISYTNTEINTHPNKADFETQNLNNPNSLTGITYSSSNENVASVNAETGTVTIGSEEGSAVITATYPGPIDENYKRGTATYTINVARQDAGFSFSESAITLTKGDEFTAPTFDNPNNLTGIIFTSSYDGVATVSDAGVITLGGNTGTAVIKATYAQTDEYRAGEATCTITVNPAGITPEPSATGKYVKITKDDELTDGQYLIVNESAGKIFNGSLGAGMDTNGNTISVTISSSEITATETINNAAFTFSSSDGSFRSSTGHYISGTSGNLSISTDVKEHTVTISTEGNANIAYSSTSSLRYNSGVTNGRFRYYSSTNQQPVQLYKYVPAESPSTIDIAISDAGMATYVSNFDLDFTNSDVKAYIAVEESNRIKFTKVDKVPAATGVLLRATNGGIFAINTTTANDEDKANVAGNKFVRGTGAAVPSQTGDKYNYILNVVNNEIGFYRAANNTVATNRAYIQTVDDARTSTGARISIIFDDEDTTTDIEDVNRILSEETVYDLQGRKIKEAKKGSLYIVNGKKVIIK